MMRDSSLTSTYTYFLLSEHRHDRTSPPQSAVASSTRYCWLADDGGPRLHEPFSLMARVLTSKRRRNPRRG